MMRFGVSVDFPLARWRLRQFHLSARPPSMAASLEPVVEQPMVLAASGEFHKIGEHVDAALFDGRGLRVFILVDHVLVGGLVHDLLDFGFDPGGAEGGEILLRVAVEDELIVDGLVDGLRVLLRFGELVGLGLARSGLRTRVGWWERL